MTVRRQHIQQRKRIFLGCEGESEVSYAAFLSDMLKDAGLHIHIDARPLSPGAGDPEALIKRAKKEVSEREKKRGIYKFKFLLIDSDQLNDGSQRIRAIERAAASYKFTIIWQKPCHEAFLLRHFENCESLRPPSSQVAASELKIKWPDYAKPMNRAQLQKRFNIASVRRVALVEPDFKKFLEKLGLSI